MKNRQRNMRNVPPVQHFHFPRGYRGPFAARDVIFHRNFRPNIYHGTAAAEQIKRDQNTQSSTNSSSSSSSNPNRLSGHDDNSDARALFETTRRNSIYDRSSNSNVFHDAGVVDRPGVRLNVPRLFDNQGVREVECENASEKLSKVFDLKKRQLYSYVKKLKQSRGKIWRRTRRMRRIVMNGQMHSKKASRLIQLRRRNAIFYDDTKEPDARAEGADQLKNGDPAEGSESQREEEVRIDSHHDEDDSVPKIPVDPPTPQHLDTDIIADELLEVDIQEETDNTLESIEIVGNGVESEKLERENEQRIKRLLDEHEEDDRKMEEQERKKENDRKIEEEIRKRNDNNESVGSTTGKDDGRNGTNAKKEGWNRKRRSLNQGVLPIKPKKTAKHVDAKVQETITSEVQEDQQKSVENPPVDIPPSLPSSKVPAVPTDSGFASNSSSMPTAAQFKDLNTKGKAKGSRRDGFQLTPTMFVRKKPKTINPDAQPQNYCFTVLNLKNEPNARPEKWILRKAYKRFVVHGITTFPMGFKQKSYYQTFFVSTEEEAQQVRKSIPQRKWINCLSINGIRASRVFIWEGNLSKNQVILASLLATKASNDKEMMSENDELAKRLKSNTSVQFAINDEKLFKKMKKELREDGKKYLDELKNGKKVEEMDEYETDTSIIYDDNVEAEDGDDIGGFFNES